MGVGGEELKRVTPCSPIGKVYFKRGFYLKANQELERFLELALIVKNDSDISEQIEEARKLVGRIKIYQSNN